MKNNSIKALKGYVSIVLRIDLAKLRATKLRELDRIDVSNSIC